jgi:hypothetical protein
MKKIFFQSKKWLLILPVFLALFACDDKLDMKPQQSIDASTALNTPENIKTALVGDYLQAREADIFGSQFNEFSELLAATSDLSFIGTYAQPREIIQKEITVTNSYVESCWIEAYNLINYAILIHEKTISSQTAEERNLVEEGRVLTRVGHI